MVLNLLLLIWCSTGLPLGSRPKCEGGNATQKKMRLEGLANGEDRVAGERLVDEHARDAHHGGAAVVALGIQLPGLAQEELVLADLCTRAQHKHVS